MCTRFQAIDVAKYFKWKTGAGLLFQLPTALTVDAPWGHRAAIRFSGVVRYVGFAVPTAIYVDLDVLARAPPALIRSGVGDVLCLHTAHRDWELATRAGRAGVWPYDPAVAAQARAVLDKLLERASDVRKLNDAGISALVEALAYGGAAFHAHGWNPRPVEVGGLALFSCGSCYAYPCTLWSLTLTPRAAGLCVSCRGSTTSSSTAWRRSPGSTSSTGTRCCLGCGSVRGCRRTMPRGCWTPS